MANKRLDGHTYKYRQLYKLFRNPHVTADLKRLATLTDFMPKTMYAPEVWGIGTPQGGTLLGKIQAKLTRLAKAAIRPGGRNPHAQVAIREMGLKPVADITALQTMRLFNKCITMRGRNRDENLLSELLHSPDPRPVTLKAERNAPLYSLKIACNTIFKTAKSAGTLQYLNLEITVQARALKSTAPADLEQLHDGSLPATRSVDNWSYTNDTHFQNITLRDHHLPTKNAAQLTPSLKILAHALLENRDHPLTTGKTKDGRLLARAPTYWHHLVVARGSVHIHRDIEALYPHLAHGFTLQSQLRCGTYPLSIHRQQPDQVLPDSCPHCPDNTALRERETYDHLLFRCTAWDQHRIDAARYALRLMTGLMPDIRGMHRTNMEYAEALEAQDRAILSKCTTQCSDKCMYHTIVKAIIPQPDYTGPADVSTLLQRYKDNRPKEGLRLPAPTPLPSDVERLKRICFSNCPLAKSKELSQAIDARQQSIDILQLHGNVRILTLPHEHIPGELNKLCGSSVMKLYSKNGRLQHIDVFVHIYVARLLLLINDTRKQHNTRPP